MRRKCRTGLVCDGDKKLNLSVLQFDIFELAIMVTSELKMLQEEGARVGLGGDYQL